MELLFPASLTRTQPGPADDPEEQESFPADLSLHPDIPPPEGLGCPPANMVEVHQGSQTGKGRCSPGRFPPVSALYQADKGTQ